MKFFFLALFLIAPISIYSAASDPEKQISATVQILRGHEKPIESVAFNPEGTKLASGSWDGAVRIWDAKTGACLRILENDSTVSTVVYSGDGITLASAAAKVVFLWNMKTGAWRSAKCPEQISSMAYNVDSRCIVVGTICGKIFKLDTQTCKFDAGFQGHKRSIYSIAQNSYGTSFSSGSSDGTVCVWDAESNICDHVFEGHNAFAKSLAYSPSGKTIAVGSGDGIVRIWDIVSGACAMFKSLDERGAVESVAYSPDGKTIAFGLGNKVHSLDACNRLSLLDSHSRERRAAISSVAFSPDGKTIASGAWDSTVRLS